MSFEPITINSQEELDAMFKDRVARAEKKFDGWISPEDLSGKLADKDKEIDSLSATIKSLNDEKATFDTQLAERDTKIKQYEIGSVKTKIAHELGLSYEATQFLQGEDEESIRTSAESLKGLVNIPAPMPVPEPILTGKDANDEAYKSMLKDLFRKE